MAENQALCRKADGKMHKVKKDRAAHGRADEKISRDAC
jgi:hypothetical protein